MGKFKNFSFDEKPQTVLGRRGRSPERKERMTYWLDPELIDKVQAYAYWTPQATISSTVEQALREFFRGRRVKPLPPDLQRKRDAAKARKMQ
ncbi:MAG: hypothetical protein ACE5LH_04380 [Fidelibacterota bacterium]